MSSSKHAGKNLKSVMVPISIGELVDKITILQIKMERIESREKKINIDQELTQLLDVCEKFGVNAFDVFANQLKQINLKLWDIEDQIRIKEKNRSFDEEFIGLARAVYVTNDERFRAKSAINEHYGSFLREEKSYEDYT